MSDDVEPSASIESDSEGSVENDPSTLPVGASASRAVLSSPEDTVQITEQVDNLQVTELLE